MKQEKEDDKRDFFAGHTHDVIADVCSLLKDERWDNRLMEAILFGRRCCSRGEVCDFDSRSCSLKPQLAS